MANKKIEARVRRAKKARSKIRELRVARLCVHRTTSHIYAQLFMAEGGNVVAVASSLEKDLKLSTKDAKGKVEVASAVGKLIATRAKEKGIKKVAFDRSGFKYHGRIKALADAAREGGLEF